MDNMSPTIRRTAPVPEEFVRKWEQLTEQVRCLEAENARLKSDGRLAGKPDQSFSDEQLLILVEFLRAKILAIANLNIDSMNHLNQGRPHLALKKLEAAEIKFDEIRRCRGPQSPLPKRPPRRVYR